MLTEVDVTNQRHSYQTGNSKKNCRPRDRIYLPTIKHTYTHI